MDKKEQKHWSKVEYLHESVKNPNIVIKGTKSYYSNAYRRILKTMSSGIYTVIPTACPILKRPLNMTSFTSAIISASARKQSF